MVTMMERLERTNEEWSFLIRTEVDFGLYFFSKMDEVHIILDMYMDEARIPMLVKMGIKAQIMGVDQYIYTTGST